MVSVLERLELVFWAGKTGVGSAWFMGKMGFRNPGQKRCLPLGRVAGVNNGPKFWAQKCVGGPPFFWGTISTGSARIIKMGRAL